MASNNAESESDGIVVRILLTVVGETGSVVLVRGDEPAPVVDDYFKHLHRRLVFLSYGVQQLDGTIGRQGVGSSMA